MSKKGIRVAVRRLPMSVPFLETGVLLFLAVAAGMGGGG